MIATLILYVVSSAYIIFKFYRDSVETNKYYTEALLSKHAQVVELDKKYKSLQEEYEYCSNKLEEERRVNQQLVVLLKENR